jgi:aspartyl-tRNA(Asn)/glutamyl-tRNA(Gln) amidotransferase subunit B
VTWHFATAPRPHSKTTTTRRQRLVIRQETMTTTVEVGTKYETVIGLEVHVQLQTRSKMFCSCPNDFARAEPNTHTCPICMGMPGTLPVTNRQAVEFTIMTGLALNCSIPPFAKFDRKNYPYPDLMKGYQISQYDMPFCVGGWLAIGEPGNEKRAGITRVHLEEDTANLKHETGADGETFSLVDVNRAGAPLMEIVGEPDLREPEDARQYLIKLRQILRYIGVSRANMEEGNMRCDANVSLRLRGATEFGSKVEVKNMNSFRAVFRALEFEIVRQTEALDRGEYIPQETRGWVEGEGRTVSQRSKEAANDYRYFPEPDLPPFVIKPEEVEAIRAKLPELPDARRARFEFAYALPPYDAALLTESRDRADWYETAVAAAKAKLPNDSAVGKAVANWFLGDFIRLQNAASLDLDAVKLRPEGLADLVALVESGQITGRAAKNVLEQAFASGRAPSAIVEESGLRTVSDSGAIDEVARRVIAANPKPVADYRAGKTQALQNLFGQVMKEMRGAAKPDAVRAALERLLAE